MAKQTLSDAELMFSAAQVIADSAANTASTNELDLGASAMGEGVVVKGVVNVTTLTGTLVVKVAHKATATVAVTDNPITLTTIASGVTGQYYFALPQNVNRYVKLFYTCGTTAADNTVTAYLTAEQR